MHEKREAWTRSWAYNGGRAPARGPSEATVNNDVTYLAIILGLFVLAFLLVAACDRIIGPDAAAPEEQGGVGAPAPAPADPEDEMEVAA
jgi:hypothetical protein